MSEPELKELVDSFLEEFWKLEPLEDAAIRDPPSKHQRKLRALIDMVRAFEAKYYRNFKEPRDFLKNEGGKE